MTARQNKNSLSADPYLSSNTVLPATYIYLDGHLLLNLAVFHTHKHGAEGGERKKKKTISVFPIGL